MSVPSWVTPLSFSFDGVYLIHTTGDDFAVGVCFNDNLLPDELGSLITLEI